MAVAVVSVIATPTGRFKAQAEPATSVRLRGVYAVRGGQIVAAESPDVLMSPASVLKLAVSAAALHQLGPAYRVTTVVRVIRAPHDGRIAGDLIVEAAGDPTWNRRFFAAPAQDPIARLARAVAARGVSHVEGDLVIDASRFPGRAQPIDRALAELSLAYAAPTSAVAIDENAVRVRMAPGDAVGQPGTVDMTRARPGAPRLRNEIQTVGSERHGYGTVAILPLWDSGDVLVRGEYPISEPAYDMAVSVPLPSHYAGAALRGALAEAGVEVAGAVRVRETGVARPAAGGAGGAGIVLARLSSPPLVDWLPPILTDSHNWYAEMLVRHVAHAADGEGRIDEGLDAVRAFLVEEVGIPSTAFSLADASGLSADNLITARAVVTLLSWIAQQPWGNTFVGALASSGRGTLASWGALPAVAAKTGSRRHTTALAGFLDPAADRPVVFAFLCDHTVEPRSVVRREIAARLRAWVDTATLHGGDRE